MTLGYVRALQQWCENLVLVAVLVLECKGS